MQFRRTYQRRLAPGEPDIITLRDVKDVVLFLATPRPPPEFMDLFHTKTADRFLRALILYFRIYLQSYTELRSKREALAKKLALPVVGMVERMRQDLSDARALVGRDYACLMLDRVKCWLHKGLTPRETDTRDLRIAESLIRVSARVVWVCLGRRSLGLIERETNRLFRSDPFNIAERRQRRRFEPTPVDDPPPDICKLHACSPAALELLRPRDDYRTLAIAVVDWQPKDERLSTLEKYLMCPEEELEGLMGLLGRPREDYDDMLRPLAPTKLNIESIEAWKGSAGSVLPFPLVELPPREEPPEALAGLPAGLQPVRTPEGGDSKRREARMVWMVRFAELL
ncbi:uncharacterized protein LOC126291091 [Schistocerca gregaria]|uniref:uncharacterized protein LOC126291091 n=1 Tax=Schistocerca gregaria TaxID=7010 RepID=UPI00211DBD17|nr:uncharacterized protein LOC126291091 [Schistocerca gregaria]